MWGMISMGCSKCGVSQGIYHPEKSQAMSHWFKYIYIIIKYNPISYDLILIWGSAFGWTNKKQPMWETICKGYSKCGVPQVINYRRNFFRDMPISYDFILIWGSAFGWTNKKQPVFGNIWIKMIKQCFSTWGCLHCKPKHSNQWYIFIHHYIPTYMWKISCGAWFPWDVLSAAFPK